MPGDLWDVESWSKHRLFYCLVLFSACCTLCVFGSDLAYMEALRVELASPAMLARYLVLAQFILIIVSCGFFYQVASRQPGAGADAADFHVLVESSSHGLALIDPLGIVTYANPTFLRTFRLTRAVEQSASFEAIISHCLRPEDGPRLLSLECGAERVFNLRAPAGQSGAIKLWIKRLPGRETRWAVRTRNVPDDGQTAKRNGVAAHIPDISMDAIMAVDTSEATWPIIYVNAAFEEMTGYAAAEVIGQSYRLLQGHHPAQQDPELRQAFEGGKPANLVIRGCRRDGSVFQSRLRVAPVTDNGAKFVVGVFRDLTHVLELEARLERSVSVDPVTLLPNRARFKAQLDAMLSDQPGTILVAQFNVRRFQEMNAASGDVFCNALLLEIAERLGRLARAAVARTGDCEFAFALPVVDPEEASVRMAELMRMLGVTYVLPGAVLEVGFSLGYTLAGSNADGDTLIRQAGTALLTSQSRGSNNPHCFDPRSYTVIRQRSGLIRDLQQALGSREFVLNYQPRVDLATNTIVGAEALLRWHHPVFGLQSPDRFIDVVEETGLILDIGAWAIASAAEFAVSINRDRDVKLVFGLNLSPAQLMDPNMLPRLDEIIAWTGADPAWITIEITESVFAGSTNEVAGLCRQLRERGFGVAIDDFATACSSLRQLDAFSLTEMKVDVSFVRDVHSNRYRQTVIDAAVIICGELGVTVAAEGIESEEERETLQRLGCRYGQGYLFSRPLAGADFARLVDDHSMLPVRAAVERKISAAVT